MKKYILLKKGELAYNHGASKLRPYGSCFALTTAENARIPFVYHCFSAEDQNAEFMSIELNGAEIENQLRKIVSSGARMDGLLNISFDEYTSVSVLLPGTEEQDRIADFFRHLDNLITLHQCKQNHKKEALMSYTLTKYEKETVLLYNQSHDPITISTYDPGLRRRLREFAARYPEMCRRVDKQKYPDYAEYEIKKDRVSIRLLPPMSEEKRRVASEKAKAAGLGTKGNA